MPVQTQIQTRRGTAASWTSTNPTLAAGEFGYETDTGKFKIGNGSTAWASLAYTAASTAVTYLFNATSGQTTFSGADANGLTLAYTVGAEQVYLNGVLQVRGSDYTATNGTSIVLASGALTSDVLNVIAYSAMTVTDTYTQAQADAKFVQQTNNFFAGKNKIINGDMGIWQRGTSFTFPNVTYTSDRWQVSATSTGTVTRETFTPGTAPVSGYEGQYFLRLNRTSGASTDYIYQRIEDVRTLAGQTATISFWAKASASATTGLVYADLNYGTGGSAGAFFTFANSVSLTTSWQRFTLTAAVPSVSGKTIGANSFIAPTIQLNSGMGNISIDIWGVQLEAGSIATPFQTATGTLAGELAACQRYFYRLQNGGSLAPVGNGAMYSGTSGYPQHAFPTMMRTVPTASRSSATGGIFYYLGTGTATTNMAFGAMSNRQAEIDFVFSGITAGTAGAFFMQANQFIDFSAEL